jgi:hypothetical protein
MPNRWRPTHSIVTTFAAGHAALALIFAFTADARWTSAAWTVGLHLLDRQEWAVMFGVVALLLLAGRIIWHGYALIGLLLGAMLVLWWALSFALSALGNATASLTGIVLWSLFAVAQLREFTVSVRRRVG